MGPKWIFSLPFRSVWLTKAPKLRAWMNGRAPFWSAASRRLKAQPFQRLVHRPRHTKPTSHGPDSAHLRSATKDLSPAPPIRHLVWLTKLLDALNASVLSVLDWTSSSEKFPLIDTGNGHCAISFIFFPLKKHLIMQKKKNNWGSSCARGESAWRHHRSRSCREMIVPSKDLTIVTVGMLGGAWDETSGRLTASLRHRRMATFYSVATTTFVPTVTYTQPLCQLIQKNFWIFLFFFLNFFKNLKKFLKIFLFFEFIIFEKIFANFLIFLNFFFLNF